VNETSTEKTKQNSFLKRRFNEKSKNQRIKEEAEIQKEEIYPNPPIEDPLNRFRHLTVEPGVCPFSPFFSPFSFSSCLRAHNLDHADSNKDLDRKRKKFSSSRSKWLLHRFGQPFRAKNKQKTKTKEKKKKTNNKSSIPIPNTKPTTQRLKAHRTPFSHTFTGSSDVFGHFDMQDSEIHLLSGNSTLSVTS